jgi:glutamate racemase
MAHALVFDSGVGGLSVVEELRRLMPGLYLTYAADDEFRPYGDKTETQLKQRLPGLLQTLVLASDPDVVVLACNTASTTALAEIRAVLDVPVIGVVPAIKPAAQESRTKTIAVLGTPGTVKRQYVDQLIEDHAGDCRVALHGSTKLVSLAERKLAGLQLNDKAIANEIAPLFQGQHGTAIDTIVLACTHFPLLVDELIKNAPRRVSWIDSGSAIARRTQTVLAGIQDRPLPSGPQTALLIGGLANMMRVKMFDRYGFKKTVALSSYGEMP